MGKSQSGQRHRIQTRLVKCELNSSCVIIVTGMVTSVKLVKQLDRDINHCSEIFRSPSNRLLNSFSPCRKLPADSWKRTIPISPAINTCSAVAQLLGCSPLLSPVCRSTNSENYNQAMQPSAPSFRNSISLQWFCNQFCLTCIPLQSTSGMPCFPWRKTFWMSEY